MLQEHLGPQKFSMLQQWMRDAAGMKQQQAKPWGDILWIDIRP
jgi:hypothetical protein